MSVTEQDVLANSRELAALVVRTAERVKADFAHAVSALDFPPPLARALLLLGEPATMGCLAGQLSCDQSYVTRLADDLERRGLVTRAPGEDRRVQMLALTTDGVAVKSQLAQAVSIESSVMSALTKDEQNQLHALLIRILDAS